MFDLIDECGKDLKGLGYRCKRTKDFGLEICSLIVGDEKKQRETGFDKGEYLILNCKRLSIGDEDCLNYVSHYVAKAIKFLCSRNSLSKRSKILIVGLGNPLILADSLGTKTLEYTKVKSEKNKTKIFKFAPNIFANTGINAYDVVGMLSVWLGIDGVILIDSLATSNVDRVGCSIQLNSAGITPGSAMNGCGKKIGRSTIGVPCISIGVPLMFFGEKLGRDDLILTTKDIYENVGDLAYVIGRAINEVFAM